MDEQRTFILDGAHGAPYHLDLGLAEAIDMTIWRRTSAEGTVLISKDEDFFHLANQPNVNVQLVWVRLGNCRTQTLLAALP